MKPLTLSTPESTETPPLVGVAPLAADNGHKTGAGRYAVRRVPYMAALVATKHNPAIKVF